MTFADIDGSNITNPEIFRNNLNIFFVSPEDYRLGGWSDTQALQAAIDDVTSRPQGGTIDLERGYAITGVTLKANVRLSGGKLSAVSGSTQMVEIGAAAHNAAIENVVFDGSAMSQPSGDLGGCIVQSPHSALSRNLRISDNVFTLPSSGFGYHATQLNASMGTFSGNQCHQCGGDTYQFNGGFWSIVGNVVMNSGDGGIAMNNAAAGVVSSNYIYKCVLGVGMGPNGDTANPYTKLLISGNIIDSCDYGYNGGWYSYPGREGPRYVQLNGNHITRCKSHGIYFSGRTSDVDMDLSITENSVLECGSSAFDGFSGIGHGISVHAAKGAVITDNKVVKGLGAGYTVSACEKAVFSGNVSRGNQVGVSWLNGSEVHHGDFYSSQDAQEKTGWHYTISGEMSFEGTLNGSAYAAAFHGQGVPNLKRLNGVRAIAYTSASTVWPVTIQGIDGTNAYLQADPSAANAKYKMVFDFGSYPNPLW